MNSQVGPDIPSGGLDERGGVGSSRVHDDLVTDVVGQDIVVLVERVDSAEV